MTNTPALLSLLDGPWGSDPAFLIIWSRFRQLRRYLPYRQDEEDRIFYSWIMLPLCLLDVRPFITVSILPRNVAFSGTLSKLVGLGHDEGLWRCLCHILRDHHGEGHLTRDTATLPLALGGLGLRSALRSGQSAYWASWEDTLPMVRARNRATAASFVEFLTGGIGPVSLMSAEVARRDLFGVMEFAPPSWVDLANSARPPHLLRSSLMGGAQVGNMKLHREWSAGSEKPN